MRLLWIFLLLLLSLLLTGFAVGQATPNYNFKIPSQNATNYGTLNNSNWSSLDTLLGTGLSGLFITNPTCSFNGALYVGNGAPFTTCWGSSDIGAQINAAYAALPTVGGTIRIVPKADGSCYSFVTPILFTTAGKYPLLESVGTAGYNVVAPSRGCLNFTPTNLVAVTTDYSKVGGGVPGQPMSSAFGMRNIVLINNGCITNSGCGGSAAGIYTGAINQGDSEAYYDNVTIAGFLIGYQNLGGADHYGVVWNNPQFWANAIAMQLNSPSPVTIQKGTFATNGQVFQTSQASAAPGIWADFVDFFDNGTIVNATNSTTPGQFLCSLCHFEATNGTQGVFIQGTINVTLTGGLMEVDQNVSGPLANFITLSNNSIINAPAMVFSSAVTVTNLMTANNTVEGNIGGTNLSTSNITATIAGANAAKVATNTCDTQLRCVSKAASTAFANLGTPANGSFTYCNDCTTTTPASCTAAVAASCVCVGSGTGAMAHRLNGSWFCAIF